MPFRLHLTELQARLMRAQLDHALAVVRAFLGWWQRELLACLPKRLRDAWDARIPRALIRPLPDRVEIELVDGAKRLLLVDDNALDQLDDDGLALLREVVTSRRAVMVLPHPQSLVVEADIPRGGLGHSRRIIELQLDRLSPLRPEHIHWNWTIPHGGSRFTALVAMVRTAEVARLDAWFTANAIPVPALAAAHPLAPVHLLGGYDGSDTPRRRQDRRLGRAALLLLATIPFTSLIGLAAAKSMTLTEIAILDDEVGGKIRADAAARRRADEARLVAPLAARPTLALAMARLGDGLPPSARLSRLAVGPTGLISATIEGASIEQLQAALAPRFTAISFSDGAASADAAPSPTDPLAIPSATGGPVIAEIRL